MDENVPSKDDNADDESNNGSRDQQDSAKRQKTEPLEVPAVQNDAAPFYSLRSRNMSERAEGSSAGTSSSSSENATATETSGAFKGFSKVPRMRNRNYRRSKGNEDDDNHEVSGETTDANPSSAEPESATSTETREERMEEGGGGGGDSPHQPAAVLEFNLSDVDDDEDDDYEDNNSNDWEDYEDHDEDDDEVEGFSPHRSSSSSNDDDDDDDDDEEEHGGGELFSDVSNSTTFQDADEEAEILNHPIFKKEKPKHNWHMIDELQQRQNGFSSKLQSRELFQRKCYGSLYAVKRLELMYKLEEHGGCVNSLNFHPDGSLLASGADDLKVVIWDWKVGKCLTKYRTKHKGNVFQSKFLHLSGDLHIASCARDGQVRLAQLSKEEGLRSVRLLGSHKGPCHKLIVLPDQPQIILSAGEDGVVLSHDVRGPKSTKAVTVKEDGKEVALYSIHGHPLKTHEFCVSGRDSIVRIYDQRKSSKPAATHNAFKKANRNYHVTCAVYNYNGSEILASYSDADIYLFDVNDPVPGKFIHQYQGHRNGATIKGVNFFGPKSEFVVSGSDCGHIYFWERNTESLVQWLLADDNGVVNCLEPHPQLPFICTSGLDWDIKVWVPSCEDEPTMLGLQSTIRDNVKKLSSDPSDINESQMLWMLWRHLRNSSRLRASASPRNFVRLFPIDESNSSGSDSNSTADDTDNDDFERAPNCNTS